MTPNNVKHSESARYARRNLFLLKILAIGKQTPCSRKKALGKLPTIFSNRSTSAESQAHPSNH